jgi:hypothetical protein
MRQDMSAQMGYDKVEFMCKAGADYIVASCSAIRGLGLASMSERVHDPAFSKPKELLECKPLCV